MERSIWDGDTMVTPSQNALVGEFHDKEDGKKLHLKEPKVESISCSVLSCSKLFISDAERDIHVEIHHPAEQDEIAPKPENSSFDDLYEGVSSEIDEGDNTILARDHDATIKPKLTAESLQALEDSIGTVSTESITRSMHDMSVQDPHGSSNSIMSLDETTYSATEPIEEGPASDIASEEAPKIRVPVRMLLCLWAKLVNDASRQYQQSIRQRAPGSGSHGRRNSFSTSKESLAGSITSSDFSGTQGSRTRKRSSDDGDEKGNKKSSKKAKAAQVTIGESPLGCPFNKFDSFRYGNDPDNPQYHVCSTWNDVKTAYLKQHLTRNHCTPEFQCNRCGSNLINHADLRAHQRAQTPCEVRTVEEDKIMPEIQQELGLRSRNAVGLDRKSYWEKVFDTVFGYQVRMDRQISPYYKGPFAEILQRFVHFSQARMPEVIRRSREILHLAPDDYDEHNVELSRIIMQEAVQVFMSELTQYRQPVAPNFSEQNESMAPVVSQGRSTVSARNVHHAFANILPNNWQHPAPPQMMQPVMQSSISPPQLLSNTFQLPTRPIPNSAPPTPAPVSGTGFDHLQPQQQLNYDEITWTGAEFSTGSNEFDLVFANHDRYNTASLNQNDYEGFDMIERPDSSGRQERRLP